MTDSRSTRTALEEAGDAFARLSDRAWHTNLDRAERLLALAVQDVDGGGIGNEERGSGSDGARPLRQQMAELAHQILGSAGTFGFDEVSDLAGHLRRSLAAGPVDPDELVAASQEIRTALLMRRPAGG